MLSEINSNQIQNQMHPPVLKTDESNHISEITTQQDTPSLGIKAVLQDMKEPPNKSLSQSFSWVGWELLSDVVLAVGEGFGISRDFMSAGIQHFTNDWFGDASLWDRARNFWQDRGNFFESCETVINDKPLVVRVFKQGFDESLGYSILATPVISMVPVVSNGMLAVSGQVFGVEPDESNYFRTPTMTGVAATFTSLLMLQQMYKVMTSEIIKEICVPHISDMISKGIKFTDSIILVFCGFIQLIGVCIYQFVSNRQPLSEAFTNSK